MNYSGFQEALPPKWQTQGGVCGDAMGERFSFTGIWAPGAEFWSYMNTYDKEGNDTTG